MLWRNIFFSVRGEDDIEKTGLHQLVDDLDTISGISEIKLIY